jgi:hypothetical protein
MVYEAHDILIVYWQDEHFSFAEICSRAAGAPL